MGINFVSKSNSLTTLAPTNNPTEASDIPTQAPTITDYLGFWTSCVNYPFDTQGSVILLLFHEK